MKINNSRIFTADIYELVNTSLIDYVATGNRTEEKLCGKGVVMIYFEKEQVYIPACNIKNVLDYMNIKMDLAASSGKKSRDEYTYLPPKQGDQIIKNIQPLFTHAGKTPLSQLSKIQKFHSLGLDFMEK